MIAIKDMEMPKNCADCIATCNDSVEYWNYVCSINLKDIDVNESERAEHCPLMEIITCKDCEHWHDDGIMTTCDKNIGNGFPKDYYCADAEKKKIKKI